jgi:hypothetical protein
MEGAGSWLNSFETAKSYDQGAYSATADNDNPYGDHWNQFTSLFGYLVPT